MLVLSRKMNEKIVIGETIVITVVRIDRNQVRLGIEAPNDVTIFRYETHESSQNIEKRAAEANSPIGGFAIRRPNRMVSTSGLGWPSCTRASPARRSSLNGQVLVRRS